MPALLCPRCQRANPDGAVFCYFDGLELRPGSGGAAAVNRLAQEFVFPSGRRTKSFEEFAQGCQDEWVAARDLLKQGQFQHFFGNIGRADLALAAREAMNQADPDIALTTFLGSLPVVRASAPRLDINPRRMLLGALLAGETRQLQLTITNQGLGTLQGTLTVAEGSDWLKLASAPAGQTHMPISTQREQKITLLVDTKGVPAAQTYGAKLTVITNGGVSEVPMRMDLVAQPFNKQPLQGVKTPREMAERMRKYPKAAGPVLENGEVARWFAANGWNYPVAGTPAKGVAGVQQFFEAMGLSKPPPLKLTMTEMRLQVTYPEAVRMQVGLQTLKKKWVYAQVHSDNPWLRVLTPQVTGPQQTTIGFEVDSSQMDSGPAEGLLQVVANGGQKLALRVLAEINGAPRRRGRAVAVAGTGGEGVGGGSWLQPVFAMALALFLIRLLLAPVVDLGGRGAAVRAAAQKLDLEIKEPAPLSQVGGWLKLPWASILAGTEKSIDKSLFQADKTGEISARDVRHQFAGFFIRSFVFWTWWIGALVGALLVWQRGGGATDWLWGVVAGAVAGVAGSASLACAFLVIEILPHALWGIMLGQAEPGLVLLLVWIIVALAVWMAVGAGLGFLSILAPPVRQFLVRPVQGGMAWLCRLCGLHGLAVGLAPP